MTAGVQLRKNFGRWSLGARRQDELTGGKLSVLK
jgi:hypothetical protein